MLHLANVSTPDYIFPNLCLLSKLCLQIYRKKQLIYFPNIRQTRASEKYKETQRFFFFCFCPPHHDQKARAT